jgi:hypothetical protein
MHNQAIFSFGTRFALRPQTTAFPFACELSLAPLVTFWQQAAASDRSMRGVLARVVQGKLRGAPELLEPIEDLSVIDRHRELVDILMAVAFPQASWEQAYTAALRPFHLQSFYATPSFERLLMAEDGSLRGWVNVDEQTVHHVRILHAYVFVLQQVYGIDIDFEYPLILTAVDPDTGLDRHFRMNFDGRFMEVKTVGEVKPLSDEAKKRLLANLADPQVLMEIIPPERFILHGFAVLNAVEVTDQEVLSSLKRDLIEKESIISNTRFHSLQEKLRTLFKKPDLVFGLAACQGERVFMLNYGCHIEYG